MNSEVDVFPGGTKDEYRPPIEGTDAIAQDASPKNWAETVSVPDLIVLGFKAAAALAVVATAVALPA